MADPLDTVRAIIEIDRLIHDPVRYALMAYLHVVRSADFTFLTEQLDVTRGNLSFHMAKLSEAGYVEVEKSFVQNRPRTLYRITDEGKRAFSEYRTCMVRALTLDDLTTEVPDETSD